MHRVCTAILLCLLVLTSACAKPDVLALSRDVERGEVGTSTSTTTSPGPETVSCPPAPVPGPDPEAMDVPATPDAVDPILTAVSALRCLTAPPIAPIFITRAEAPGILASGEEPEDRAEIERVEPIARLLGWIEPGTSLYDAAKELTAGLILGFYLPNTDQLYIVTEDGTVTPLAQRTVAHEWVHALQDAAYDLEKKGDAIPKDDLDAGGAMTAVVEGDALHYETEFSQQYFSEAKRLAASEEELALGADAAGSIDLGPLLYDLLMPYRYGPTFVRHLLPAGAPPLQDVYERLPSTSAEILHPELWQKGFEPEPTALPDFAPVLGAAWTRTFDGTWGEFSTANVIAGFAGTVPERELTDVDGWRGDRLQLWTSGPESVLALATTWDSDAGGEEFLGVLEDALEVQGSAEPSGFVAFEDGRRCRATGGGRVTILMCTDSPDAAALLAST